MPLRADLHFAERFLIEIGRMRIQAGQHAVDGFGDKLFVFYRLDIIAFHAVEHLGERAQLFDRQRQHRARGAVALCHRRKIKADGNADQHAGDDKTKLTQLVTHKLLQ